MLFICCVYVEITSTSDMDAYCILYMPSVYPRKCIRRSRTVSRHALPVHVNGVPYRTLQYLRSYGTVRSRTIRVYTIGQIMIEAYTSKTQ